MDYERNPFGAGGAPNRREFLTVAAVAAGGGIWWYLGRRRMPAEAAALPSSPLPPATMIPIAEFSPAGEPAGVTSLPTVVKPEAAWHRQMTRLEYDVLRKFDDEMPFSGAYWNNHAAGIYRCAACDTAVFGSTHKFDSGTGWPSFTQPLASQNIAIGRHGALPSAITCARCGSFLGDLFDDGPQPTGLRHCINSASLRFVAAETPRTATAVFAGGCFWGVDAVYRHVRGVIEVTSGYAGGKSRTADYETVSGGNTGHAESVQVRFDPATVSYESLLKIFFLVAHDPTELDRQGPDVGTQYRSVVFVAEASQRAAATAVIGMLTQNRVYHSRIVTAVSALDGFYPAEDYHQNYLARHLNQPYIMYNDLPKLERLKTDFPEWYREV